MNKDYLGIITSKEKVTLGMWCIILVFNVFRLMFAFFEDRFYNFENGLKCPSFI